MMQKIDLGRVSGAPFQYIVCEGDSRTDCISGGSNGAANWTQILATMPLFSGTLVNVAHTGDTVQSMVGQYATQGHLYSPAVTGCPGLFIFWGWTNDVGNGRLAEQIQSDLTTLLGYARADDFKIALCVDTKRAGRGVFDWATTNAIIQSVNDWAIAHPELYDYLLRPDLLFTSPVNNKWFYDGLHINDAANAVFARYVANALNGSNVPASYPRFKATLGTSSGTIPSGGDQIVPMNAITEDTHAGYIAPPNSAYCFYTVPITGRYRFNARFITTATSTGTETTTLHIHKNGPIAEMLDQKFSGANYRQYNASATMQLTAGDIITLMLNQNSGNTITLDITAGYSEFSGELISDAP